MLYNAEFLSWQEDKREADVLFVDYENVERVAVKDMYVKFRYCRKTSDRSKREAFPCNFLVLIYRQHNPQ